MLKNRVLMVLILSEEEGEWENSGYGTMNSLKWCSLHETIFRTMKSRKRRWPGHVACVLWI